MTVHQPIKSTELGSLQKSTQPHVNWHSTNRYLEYDIIFSCCTSEGDYNPNILLCVTESAYITVKVKRFQMFARSLK